MDPFSAPIPVPEPASTAVICGSASLTYGELDARADRLANLLRSRGIGRGQFVGLGLPRSLDLPIALLAILRTGAAYVPLDPAHPPALIAQMIAAADLKQVVTQRQFADAFSAATTVFVDDGNDTDFPVVAAEMDALMVAIFPSSTLGPPKAASIYRRGFSNLLDWYTRELALGPADRTLVISSPSSGLTQKNFFAPLITGGTLILDEDANYDVSRITALIRDHGVTLINCTPSAFYPLVDAAAGGNFASLATLRFVVLGGEPISIPRLRAWLEHPNCRAEIVTTYGPTECTDICAFHRLHRGNLDDHPFVPLGREIPNVRVFIRDEAQVPLPDGAVGELCIGGVGIGGGYLNDPVRTAASFTGSVYRTGDLAKRHPSGLLEFRGRADHQVKVNGFHIALGEIEVALNRHAGVREAVVTACDNRLVAHIQGKADSAELRGHLARLLPAYMVPGEFRLVEKFPLTPYGKVDRQALANEVRILQLWSGLLGHEVNDATANFFDLGGNSIHAAIVHGRLMEMTGRAFPVTHLFALPSARAIASFLAPKSEVSSAPTTQVRARGVQTGFARFKRPALR